jgi:predicted Zn-dependent protease
LNRKLAYLTLTLPSKRRGAIYLALTLLLLASYLSYAEHLCPDEQQRAQAIAQHIAQEWPLRESHDYLTRYVQMLGRRLTATAPGVLSIRWYFVVLRDRSPNAFSIGNGHVYLTEGALLFAKNESEMAAILAHEIDHQIAGHFCQLAISRSRSGFGGLRDRLLSKPHDKIREQEIGSLVQVIDLSKEKEADKYALKTLDRAGYDARAMLHVARRLSRLDGLMHMQNDRRRIEALERLLGDIRVQRARNSSEFARVKAKLAAE